MDLDYGFAIPVSVMASILDNLKTSTRPDGERYWHVHLVESGGEYSMLIPKRPGTLLLTPYIVKL